MRTIEHLNEKKTKATKQKALRTFLKFLVNIALFFSELEQLTAQENDASGESYVYDHNLQILVNLSLSRVFG